MSVEKEMKTIKRAIECDKDYAWAWHCNLAMSSYDEGLDLPAANRAAARFMRVCFGVDMTQHENFSDTQILR